MLKGGMNLPLFFISNSKFFCVFVLCNNYCDNIRFIFRKIFKMQIQPQSFSNQFYNPKFGALKVATAKNFFNGVESKIDIYKLTKKDEHFLDLLEENTNYKKLAPNMREDMQNRWQKIFHYCVEEVKDGFNQSYVALSGNRPCGIVTYYADSTSSYLDGVCKIPTPDKKVYLAGQSLILKFFKSALEENSKTVKLDAVKDGPIDVISLYEKLGFKKVFNNTTDNYQPMEMNKFKLKEQVKKLEELITYKEEKHPQEVNLCEFIA